MKVLSCVCATHSLERIKNATKKLVKSRQGATQGRLDSFFKPLPPSQPVKRQVNSTLLCYPFICVEDIYVWFITGQLLQGWPL